MAKYGSDMLNNNSKFQSEFGVYGRKLDLEFQKHSTMMSELGLLEKQYQQHHITQKIFVIFLH